MELVAADRTPLMEAAHRDQRVKRVVASFMTAPSPPMTRLLAASLWGNWDRRSAASIVKMNGVPAAQVQAATEMVVNAVDVSHEPNADFGRRCRGAILEAIGEALLQRRSQHVLTERQVRPFPTPWTGGLSDPIDLVIDDVSLEFYECKSQVREIKSKHLVQFGIIDGMCKGDRWLGFVTLMDADSLQDWLGGFPRSCPIYAYTVEDFADMATRRPTTAII